LLLREHWLSASCSDWLITRRGALPFAAVAT
jgi:hypothetical protein